MTGELSVLAMDGGTLGAVAFGLQGQRALLAYFDGHLLL